ncbi:MAG: enoyl-CoA hydratase/isomerase family protein [Alphaproteobacteria bacterium]|nr:enoyl-CoA hydratase/isomerase family protein [Alphaproteobacteria bacterium]
MGSAQLAELEALSAALAQDPHARALVSRSTKRSSKGTPIFVAGAAVTERVGWDDARVKAHVRWQRSVLGALARVPVLHVVVAGGVAYGWGTEFLLTGDYRIATPEARFALPETGLGIVPGAWGTARLAREVGTAQALRLGMTGEVLDADAAVRIGLVQEVCPDDAAACARAEALAVRVIARSPTAVAAFKAAVRGDGGEAAEAAAYDHCVDSGEAAIGRAHFDAIVRGGTAPWGPRR